MSELFTALQNVVQSLVELILVLVWHPIGAVVGAALLAFFLCVGLITSMRWCGERITIHYLT